jgi:hypothetical protein
LLEQPLQLPAVTKMFDFDGMARGADVVDAAGEVVLWM